MEAKLLGHLLKANDSETTREVEQLLADDPSAIHDLALLKKALLPLESAREEIDPPADLWLRTLCRVAEHMVAAEGRATPAEAGRTEEMIRRAAAMAHPVSTLPKVQSAKPASDPQSVAPRRRNIFAIVGLSAAALALVAPVVVHLRQKSEQAVCQDTMRQFYLAASNYSEMNEGKSFPKVQEGEKAATVAETLRLTGYLPPDQKLACPGGNRLDSGPTSFVNYAYSLGFRDESGELRGLDKRPENDSLPILADAPIRHGVATVPCNHRHGQNVLFAGGHVRFCTHSKVGVNNDDIFCKADGTVGAGLYPLDSALGRPEERP